MCGSKRTYDSQGEATYVLYTIRMRREHGGFIDPCSAIRAYYCADCGGWHLTKNQLARRPLDTDVLPGEY